MFIEYIDKVYLKDNLYVTVFVPNIFGCFILFFDVIICFPVRPIDYSA